MNNNLKKLKQLGMPTGTAANRLKKLIMFDMAQKLNLDSCHQCGKKIQKADDLSIEHVQPYLDSKNPVDMYFDLDNIAFSHQTCNSGARRNTRVTKHGTSTMYINKKCRCELCLEYRKMRYAKNKN